MRMHSVVGGILIESSNGKTSLIVTDVDDISNLPAGRDRIAHGIEDIELDIFPSDLLANDRVGSASGWWVPNVLAH